MEDEGRGGLRMRAIISEKYGKADTLQLHEVAIPALTSNQILIKVHASSLNFSNQVLLTGKPLPARLAFGMTKPKYPIPGGDVAGVVESVGEHVNAFQVGDEVYGDLSICGWGAFAEYAVAIENAIALKPRNLTFQEAAAVPMAGLTALQALRDKGGVKAGQEVLLHGASGGVGTFAIQLAKAFGASVTAVVSTRNVELAAALGADRVIDYQRDDLLADKATYDLIIGVNGSHSLSTYNRKLKERGIFVHIGSGMNQMYQTMMFGPWLSKFGKKKFVSLLQRANQKDLIVLKELIEDGKVKPVMDSSYSLSEVPKAFTYFEKGHLKGKVSITV